MLLNCWGKEAREASKSLGIIGLHTRESARGRQLGLPVWGLHDLLPAIGQQLRLAVKKLQLKAAHLSFGTGAYTVCQYNKNWMDTIGILYSLVILQQSL